MSDFDYAALSDQTIDPLDRYDALDGALDDPEARQLVGGEPESKEAHDGDHADALSPAQSARFVAIKDRLERLGYLRQGAAVHITEPDESFNHAVGWFQHDAMIKRDEWVGPQTWTALQAAFGLEGDPAMRQHLLSANDGQPTRLAWRAGLLRLAVIGLSDDDFESWRANKAADPWEDTAPQKTREAIDGGIKRLSSVLIHLKAPGASTLTEVGLLGLALDFDRVTALLAQCPEPSSDILDKDKVVDLLGKAVTVELWARGFNLDLAGKVNISKGGAIPKPSGPFREALEQYLTGEGRTPQEATNEAATALLHFPALFEVFNSDRGVGEESDDAAEDRVEAYFREDPDRFEQGRSLLAKLGSRLFDGIKRVVGWFTRLVRRGVELISKTVEGTLGFFMRVGQRFARDGFHAVRRARQILVESVKFFTDRDQVLPEKGVAWQRSLDGDFCLAVDNTKLQSAGDAVAIVAVRAKIVRLAGQLLGAVLKLARKIITGSVTGWLGFWLTLMRVVRGGKAWLERADTLWRKLQTLEGEDQTEQQPGWPAARSDALAVRFSAKSSRPHLLETH